MQDVQHHFKLISVLFTLDPYEGAKQWRERGQNGGGDGFFGDANNDVAR